jgi:hypothetical protein
MCLIYKWVFTLKNVLKMLEYSNSSEKNTYRAAVEVL